MRTSTMHDLVVAVPHRPYYQLYLYIADALMVMNDNADFFLR
jgi:hypothetical protein